LGRSKLEPQAEKGSFIFILFLLLFFFLKKHTKQKKHTKKQQLTAGEHVEGPQLRGIN
jgi:preprotein translocase subunit YajC